MVQTGCKYIQGSGVQLRAEKHEKIAAILVNLTPGCDVRVTQFSQLQKMGGINLTLCPWAASRQAYVPWH